MIKNKILFTAIILSGLMVCPISADADSASSLLKMDVKRSSAADTVDVTFYTTGVSTNSLVTRKADNRYVVLLPNTQGSQSVVPSLGGVKDLISNVDVKSIDDGIGGYTKVTFSTTKPIKIQTYSKKTEPLTKAQEEYKNLISKHESVPAIRTGSTTTHVAKSATQTPVSTTPKTTQTNTNTPKTVAQVIKSAIQAKPVQQTNKPAQTTPVQVKSQPQKTTQTNTQVKPKETPAPVATKPVENTPKVNVPTEAQTKSVKPAETKPVENTKPVTPEPEVTDSSLVSAHAGALGELETFGLNKSKLRKIPLIGGLIILGLFLFIGIFNILVRMAAKSSQEFRKLFDTPASRPEGIDKEALKNIMNDESLNWQEKYRRYTQTEDKANAQAANDYTFVTDMSGKKDAVVKTGDVSSKKKKHSYPKKETKLVTKQISNDELKARISQMEYALSQTPSFDRNYAVQDNSVKSEESAISQKMASVKLKTFARSKSLKEASRNLYNEYKQEINEQYKEGRFVKLKNSPLSVNSRKSKQPLGASTDVINSEEQLITVSKKAQKDIPYSSTSVGEYFAILDSEPAEKIANSFQKRMSDSDLKFSSSATNPISSARPRNPYGNYTSDYMSMDNMDIKSTYTIDSQRSIHLVEMDGHSALIGKNGNNISLIKDFETLIYKPLQVRRDYNSVYIVRAGEFKCLVDAAAPKFGVLLEI